MIRVVVTGSECTGKTTLAGALAARYRAPLVAEYARRFVRRKGAAPGRGDVEAIASGQMALEDAAAGAAAGSLLVLDTDLLSTVVYSRHYYGSCPDWVERESRRRTGDLYLLAGIDVPWTPDGAQRDRGDRREEMQALFREELNARGARVVELRGPHEERLAAAAAAADRLLERG